jgi:hypothetical protein
MVITAVLFSRLSYLFWPISEVLWPTVLPKAGVITISLLRLIMMFLAARLAARSMCPNPLTEVLTG